MEGNKQRGFILATTVWMVAILAILAGIFHSYVEREVSQAQRLKDRVQTELDMRATLVSLRYLLATRRFTYAGVTVLPEDQGLFVTAEGVADVSPLGNELRLDGRLYRGLGSTVFTLQDQAGLLGLNTPLSESFFTELLREKVSTQKARELSASLEDYIDENTERRFNGAEAGAYRRAGRPAPTNWFLRSHLELRDVLGWEQFLEQNDWYEYVANTHANVLNVNTAPLPLLSLLMDLDTSQASKVIAARELHPFRSLDGLAATAGVVAEDWEDGRFRFFASDTLRITLSCDGCEYRIVESLELTPEGFYGPWLTDYSYVAPSGVWTGNNDQAVSVVAGDLFSTTLPSSD